MKASKFSDAQKAFIIKQGEEGTPVLETLAVLDSNVVSL
jgi:putative transposase